MAGKNLNPMLGWHPPPELAAWVRAEAQRRNVPLSTVLNEAITQAKQAAKEGWTMEEQYGPAPNRQKEER
jgi:hypothetical protein